jgi:translocation and assembly module TamB
MARALRIAARTCGAVLLFCVVLIALILIGANTSGGRAYLERLTNRLTDGMVQITGLRGRLPAAIELERLELRDPHGVWLTAEHVSLRWAPQALLTRHIRVSMLHAARVDLERAPEYEPSPPESAGGEPSLPHIEARELRVDVLAIGPQLAGRQVLLTLEASGRLNSLDDAVATVLAHRVDDESDRYRVRLQFDPTHVDASVAIDEQSGGVLQDLLQLPELGALHATAELQGPHEAARLQLHATAGALQASARGALNLTAGTADLAIDAHAPAAMSPREDLAWQRMDLTGRVSGPWSAPEAQGDLLVEELTLPGAVRAARLRAAVHMHAGMLSVQADGERIALPGKLAGLLRDSPLHAEASMRFDNPEHPIALSARHRLFALTAQVTATSQPGATFDLALSDLAPLAALAGQSVRGRANLRGTVTTVMAGTRIDSDVQAQLAGPAAVTDILGRAPRLQASALLSGRELSVSRLQLTGAAGSLNAAGSLALNAGTAGTSTAAPPLRAQWTLNVPNLAVLSSLLAGSLTVSGRASGWPESFAADMQATSELAVRGSPLGTIQASLEARNLPGAPTVRLRAAGTLDRAPLLVDATVSRRGEATRIEIDRAEWRSARADADMTLGASLAHSTGRLRLHVDHLGELEDLIGMPLQGSVAAELRLTPVHGRTDVHLRVAADDVVAAGIAGNAVLTASGPLQTPGLHLAVQLPDLAGSPATLNAAGQLDLAKRELRLTQLTAAYRHQTPHLLSPAELEFANGLALKGPRIGVRKAVVSLDGRLSPSLELHVTAHDIDPDVVNAFVPGLLAQGSIGAEIELSGSPRAPLGQATLEALNLHLAAPAVRDLPAVNLRASAKLHGSTADLQAHLDGGPMGSMTLSGAAPTDSDGHFDLKLAGNLDLTLANALLEAKGAHAGGMLTADLAVTGTGQAPQIGGTVTLTRGDLRDYRLGVHVSDINGTMTGGQGMLRISQLTGRAAPGEVTLSGWVGVLLPGIPIDLQLQAQNATPITSDILTARLDADLRYQGALLARSNLSGTINVRRADINIPNTFPPNVVVLDVRRRGQAPPPPPAPQATLLLGLTLNAPRQILVRGRGLDAELGGQLRIHGSSDAPRVDGGFDMIRGRLALGTGSLRFTTGRVSFDSAGLKGKIDPSLDFTAQTTTADATATLRVTGYADSPQFDLTSSPPMPQDEILSRLLFGQSAAGLSSMQAAQLGQSLMTLTGLGGSGIDLLGKLQKGLGLDRLTLGSITTGTGTQQNSFVTLEAGRYVSPRVFVSGRESELGTQLGVDVELTQRLRLTTRLGNSNTSVQAVTPDNDPGSSIGLSYQFEY